MPELVGEAAGRVRAIASWYGGRFQDFIQSVVIMAYVPRLLLLCTVVVLATTCATASRAGDRRSGSQMRLSHADLEETSELTLFNAIQRLRPLWLRARGSNSARGPAPVIVYMDNVRVGGVSILYDIAVESVEAVSFVSASDATTRWGTGVAGGVIEVTSRSG